MQELKIECLKGTQIHDYLSILGKLRMEVFKEYPYLYEGDLDYETSYHEASLGPEKLLIIVRDVDHIVGASTANPLEFETLECQKPFLDKGYDITKIFYFGESVLLPPYRGKGIYRHFFEHREAAAREYGSQFTTFCTVARALNDMKRPKEYVPLDKVWQHYHYQIQPHLNTFYEWKEIGEKEQTKKRMVFWMKKL